MEYPLNAAVSTPKTGRDPGNLDSITSAVESLHLSPVVRRASSLGNRSNSSGYSEWTVPSSEDSSSSLLSFLQMSDRSVGETDVSRQVRELFDPQPRLVDYYRRRATEANRKQYQRLKESIGAFIDIIKCIGKLVKWQEERVNAARDEAAVICQWRLTVLEALLRVWIHLLEVKARRCRTLQHVLDTTPN